MNEGYLIPAIRNGLVDYVEQAEFLAATLRVNDPKRSIAILVRDADDVDSDSTIFDYIVELPYGVSSETDLEQDCALWQVYDATPFDSTIVINSCSLMVSPMNWIWELLVGKDVLFPSHTKNYRQVTTPYRFKFNLHEKNKIPKISSGVFGFNQTDRAKEFFDFCGPIFSNWRESQKELLVDKSSGRFSSTLMMSLAASILHETVEIDTTGNFYYTDLTTDNIHTIFDKDVVKDWIDLDLPVWLHSNSMKVGNFDQHGIVVYNHKKFLTHEFKRTIWNSYIAASEKKENVEV